MAPCAAPHPHVGTAAQGTAQAARGCPHHLCRTRTDTVVVHPSRHPTADSPRMPVQGSVPPGNFIPAVPISLAGCCPITGSALLPKGDFLLSLSYLQPTLP